MLPTAESQEQMQRNILARLKRIEGQIRGLQAMIADSKECEDILVQVRAAQSALKAVGAQVLKSYLLKCYREVGENPTPEAMFQRMDRTVTVLTKFLEG